MRAKDIEIDKIYRLKDNGYYFRALEVLKPNATKGKNYVIVKGTYSQSGDCVFGLLKGFRPKDLEERG